MFVLMDNHFHMLISTPHANLSEIMANFMRETTRQINRYSGRINQAYGARHFRSIVESSHYYLLAYKYLYRNPVEAGIVNLCEEYPYSSLNFLLGISSAAFPVVGDLTLFSDVQGTLEWINQKPREQDLVTVRQALKRNKFSLPKDPATKKKNRLEIDML